MANGGFLRQGERSGCLIAVLVISTLANAVYFLLGIPLTLELSRRSDEVFALVLASTILSGAALACLVGIWLWKKWGLYGYAGLGVLGVVLQFMSGDMSGGVIKFIVLLVVVITMAPAMRQMR